MKFGQGAVSQIFIVKISIGMLVGTMTLIGTGTTIISVTETASGIGILTVPEIILGTKTMREGVILIEQETMPLIEDGIAVYMVKNRQGTMTETGKEIVIWTGTKTGRWKKTKIMMWAERRNNSQEIDLGMFWIISG